MNTALNRTTVLQLTNKSGGSVAKGDVVIIDLATASSFTTTTTGAYTDGQIGVILDGSIANNAVGAVAVGGYVPQINLSGSASLGDLFKTHTVAKQAVRHAAPVVSGDFGMVLATGTTPAAILFGSPKNASSITLASVAEAGTGTDTSKAVTPAGLFPAFADVASGSTTNIGAATTDKVRITGTTTITAFDTIAAGIRRTCYFAGALTLTHNGTSLILPGAANITTAAGDSFEAISLGSGNWKVVWYQKANGQAVVSSGGASSPNWMGLLTYTAPSSSGWSWDNQVSSTIDSAAGYEYLYAPNQGAVKLSLRYRTPANSHYRIEVAILYDMHVRATYGDGGLFFGFRDSGGKLIGFMDFAESGAMRETVYKWNTSTSVSGATSASSSGPTMSTMHRPLFLRVDYDGTNLVFYRSPDAYHWEQYYTETRATFLAAGTPDVAFGAYCNSSKIAVALLHWTETPLA